MISHVISTWSTKWSWHAQSRDQCMISFVISAGSATWSVHEQDHDQCMIRLMISAWSVTWSVHDQTRYQWMIRPMISAWSVRWSVHYQPRDQCMISQVISAWAGTWVQEAGRDRSNTHTKQNVVVTDYALNLMPQQNLRICHSSDQYTDSLINLGSVFLAHLLRQSNTSIAHTLSSWLIL